MPRKNTDRSNNAALDIHQQQKHAKENTMNDTTQCKAVDCTIKPVDGSEYCANHHVENEWLKQEQEKIKYDQDVFMMENDTLLTKVKMNSVSSLVDVSIGNGYLSIPLPKKASGQYQDTSVEIRQKLMEKVPYFLLQGKKGSGKLATSVERIEQHLEHLLSAFADVLSTVDYLENGIKRSTHDAVKTDTKRAMLNNTPDVALQPWATSLGIDHTLPREQIINLMMEKI